jgi:hypothetical protein
MNLAHIINLFRAYLIESKKRILICCLVTFGIVTFGFTISAMPEASPAIPYIVLFFLVGLGNSNLVKVNSTHFNNLPATTCEKFTHAVISIIVLGIVLQICALAGACTGHYIFLPLHRGEINTHGFSFLGLVFSDSIKWYLVYAAFLSVFLFGSIYFKKNAFIKTLGIGTGLLFGYGLYFLVLLYITFGKMLNSDYPYRNSININLTDHPFFHNHWYIFPIAIMVFFLSLTYLRLRETEV